MSFRDWGASRIVLLSLAWILLSIGVTIWRAIRLLEAFDAQTGSHGVVAVSGGIAEAVAPILGPPLLLVGFWIAARRQARP
jgi:hypothetical protein